MGIEILSCWIRILNTCFPHQNLPALAHCLLIAADQYDLAGLKLLCEKALCSSLRIGNCLELLVLADLHNADILKPFVTEFVVANAQVRYGNRSLACFWPSLLV